VQQAAKATQRPDTQGTVWHPGDIGEQPGVDPDAKITAAAAFVEQANPAIAPVLTGCRFRLLMPAAFHHALRVADRALRAFSLEAAFAFLKISYDLGPQQLVASVAPFAEKMVEELRIGIAKTSDEDNVIEGVVWPLLGDEEDTAMEEIESALKELGNPRLVSHRQRFPMEYCDDCGAPVFPTAAGHAVHAELPDAPEDHSAAQLH
jgi:hypothetical protein